MSATETPAAPTSYIPMDDITRLVHADKSISLENMPKSYKASGNYEHLSMDKGVIPIFANGKQIGERARTIQDANRGNFRYAWLDKESKASPHFQGYRFVTKDSPAAQADGEAIPERHWSGRDFIQKGSLFYCFCLESYGKDYKEDGHKRTTERLKSFTEDQTSAELKGNDGESMGRVVTNSHTVTEVEDTNNDLPMGRGKKG